MTTDKILLGYEVPSGKDVEIRVFHTLITGQSQYSGKTTTLKAMATRAAELGYKVLIFDTKEQEADYSNFGSEVPVVVRDTLDSLQLLHLLESIMQTKLSRYFPILSELINGGPNVGKRGKSQSLKEVSERAHWLETHTKNGFVQGAARTLWELLDRLIEQTRDIRKTSRLELNDGINRMVMNELEIQSQQVVIAMACEDALKIYKRKVILVIDEAFKFIPQDYGSACTYTIQRVITQGAMTGVFMWISTQFIAPTDKAPLKACAVKILGTQDTTQEFKHTLDLIPGTKLKPRDVSDLQLGHFYVKTKEHRDERLVFVRALGRTEEWAREVAEKRLFDKSIGELVEEQRLGPGESATLEHSFNVDTDTGKVTAGPTDVVSLTTAEFKELEERIRTVEAKASSG